MGKAVIVVRAMVCVALMAIVVVKVLGIVWQMVEMVLDLAIAVCRHCMCVTWYLSVALGMSATKCWFLSGWNGLSPRSSRDGLLEQRFDVRHWRLGTCMSIVGGSVRLRGMIVWSKTAVRRDA